MAQLTVRNVDDQVVRALKRRAAGHGHSAEAEHREILRQALLEQGRKREKLQPTRRRTAPTAQIEHRQHRPHPRRS